MCTVVRSMLSYVEHQPTVRIMPPSGRTALSLAAATARRDALEALVQAGCALDACSAIGATALNYAAANGDASIVDVLIKAGASVDASTSQNGSPLLWAVSTAQEQSVKALLAAGADANAVNSKGASALAMAAGSGKVEIVKALLQAGATPQLVAEGGITALHAAANAGATEVIELLIQAGSNPEAKDAKGHKAVHEAAVANKREAVKALLSKTQPDEGVAEADWTVENIMQAAAQARDKTEQEAVTAPKLQVPAPEEPNPALAVTLKKLGDQAFRAKDFAAALEHYTTSLRHDTSKHIVWANRSATLLALNQAEEALRDAQMSRSINKAYAKAWYREGKAFQALGRWEDAACAFFEGHCVEPENNDLEVSFKYAIQEGKKQHKAAEEGK
mmetsp:Transcript_26915/g.75833  ORF Transcript_26915/g.75833 Transcript_26915/m.75833 type:complete len:390 (+) Transcript_26915:447-1616(+)